MTVQWLQQAILPVVLVPDEVAGLYMAEGLLQGGISQIEITLRTPAALQSMAAIAREFPDMRISAGTVLTPAHFDQSADHGANLFISPGFTETLAEHAKAKKYQWVPGVASASEMMRALEAGYELLKFFPAMTAGGPKALESITAPLAHAKIIPTGGVTLENLATWKTIPAVQAVGGTWLTANLAFGHTQGVPASSKADIVQTVAQRAQLALAVWQQSGLNI